MDVVQKREQLNIRAAIAAAGFMVLTLALLLIFKYHEDYFDTHGRIGVLVQSEQEELLLETTQLQYRKRNFQVTLEDSAKAQLVIELKQPLAQEQVGMSDEFTGHKLVLTLKEATQSFPEGSKITSDSTYMEAVGVYKQNQNIVIEIFCNAAYAYDLVQDGNQLIVEFSPIRERYEKVAVLYTPWEDRGRFISEEWQKELAGLSEKLQAKIYSCATMQEEYTQEQAVAFANEVRADVLLGIQVQTQESQGIYTVCNPQYYIPEFGSVEAAAFLTDNLTTQLGSNAAVTACTEQDFFVQEAIVPAAMAKVGILEQQDATLEKSYQLNHNLQEALKLTIEQAWTDNT